LHANLCEDFEANMKRMMRINGVGEYEVIKINIRLDSLQSELKKSCEYGAP
jgi:hypothetical protein